MENKEKIYLNEKFQVKEGKYPNQLDVWIPKIEALKDFLIQHQNSYGGINLRIVKKRIPPPDGKATHYCEVNNWERMPGGDLEIEKKPLPETEEDEGLPF